jgi:hypothetical protein
MKKRAVFSFSHCSETIFPKIGNPIDSLGAALVFKNIHLQISGIFSHNLSSLKFYCLIVGLMYLMYVRSALIIQGPILSTGRTGKSINNPLSKDSVYEIVDFDSREIVNRYIVNFSHVFDEIIISTWVDEPTSGISLQRNVHLIRSKSKTNGLKKMSNLRGLYGNNKLKQFESTYAGLVLAENLECELSVKVRTDNYVDASAILANVLACSHKLHVQKDDMALNFLGDFYFGGTTKILLDFTEANLEGRRIHRSVHLDSFYSYCKFHFEKYFSIYDYFPKADSWTGNQASLAKRAWVELFEILPIDIWNAQIWRGEGVFKDSEDISQILRMECEKNSVNASDTRKTRFRDANLYNLVYYCIGDRVFFWISRTRIVNFVGSIIRKIFIK